MFRRQAGLAGGPDRPGGNAAIELRPRRPATRSRCRSRRAHGRHARSRPTSTPSPCSSRRADGFRNYYAPATPVAGGDAGRQGGPAGLTVPEMTALVGGMRALGANSGGVSTACSRTPRPLSNDFFVNLLDMGTQWSQGRQPTALRGTRPRQRRAEVDRHAGGPDLRLQRRAARRRRGVRLRGRRRGVRPRLRRRLDQGHDADRFDLANRASEPSRSPRALRS
jgi:hypothetical protein